MKVAIKSRDLEVLRKSVSGLNADEIARELKISKQEVDAALKVVLKSTASKEPLQAIQTLAKNGFVLSD